jgi:hypothetical protein
LFRVVALPAPTEREKSQMYVLRYLPHLPAAGEVVIFDRSWYNRAGVERVMGFCTSEMVTRFLETTPGVEQAMVDSGIILIKYWLEGQRRRADQPVGKPDRRSPENLETLGHGPVVLRPLVRLLPGPGRHVRSDGHRLGAFVAHTDDKKRGRLNIISHLLGQVPYEPLPKTDVTLPKRQKPGNYKDPTLPLTLIPTPF